MYNVIRKIIRKNAIGLRLKVVYNKVKLRHLYEPHDRNNDAVYN